MKVDLMSFPHFADSCGRFVVNDLGLLMMLGMSPLRLIVILI